MHDFPQGSGCTQASVPEGAVLPQGGALSQGQRPFATPILRPAALPPLLQREQLREDPELPHRLVR